MEANQKQIRKKTALLSGLGAGRRVGLHSDAPARGDAPAPGQLSTPLPAPTSCCTHSTHQTLLPCTKETPLPCTHSTSAATKVQLAGVTRIGWQETPAKYCTLGGLNYESVRRMRKQKDFLVPDNAFPLSNPFYSLHSAAQRSSSLLGVALQTAVFAAAQHTPWCGPCNEVVSKTPAQAGHWGGTGFPVTKGPSWLSPPTATAGEPIHSLFQCLPQVLEPALRRHQLLQLIDQRLCLQETQCVTWIKPWGKPQPCSQGVTPAVPRGHPIPLCCTDHRSRHSCSCSTPLRVQILPRPLLQHLVPARGAEQALGAEFLQCITKAVRLFLSPAAHLHQCLFQCADLSLCSKIDGVVISEKPTQRLWAVPGSAPCRYHLLLHQVTQHKDSFCSSITGLRSTESQFTDVCVCTQLQ